jgi:selenium-binding protein 1
MQALAETLAYVALLNPDPSANDALAVLDVDPASPRYGLRSRVIDMPGAGDGLHQVGWNACSSCLCPNAPTRICRGAFS